MQQFWIVFGASLLVEAVVFVLQQYFFKRRIEAMEKKHREQIAQERANAVKQSKAVTRGKVSEEMLPMFPDFPYNLEDSKFMGMPVDYIIFDGMSEFRDGNKDKEITIILADVKYNTARRTAVQSAIKKAIDNGRIKFQTMKVSEDNALKIK